MAVCFCYMTAGSREEGLKVGRTLVEERLAACANLIEGMTSIYRWQDVIEQDAEVVLIAKTRSELVPRLTERVKALHSYDCPCVVALAIDGGNQAFIDWIAAETETA